MSIIEPLKKALSEKEAEIRRLTDDAEALRRTISILGKGQALDSKPPPGLTVGDAAEDILRKASEPLHVSVIVEELKKIDLLVSKEKVSTALRKDRRKRFRNLGRNTFELVKK